MKDMKEFRWGKEEGLGNSSWMKSDPICCESEEESLKGHCIGNLQYFMNLTKDGWWVEWFGAGMTNWTGRQSSDHKGPNLSILVSFLIINLDFIWLKKSQGGNLTYSIGILKTAQE